jgi:hypothetical protein
MWSPGSFIRLGERAAFLLANCIVMLYGYEPARAVIEERTTPRRCSRNCSHLRKAGEEDKFAVHISTANTAAPASGPTMATGYRADCHKLPVPKLDIAENLFLCDTVPSLNVELDRARRLLAEYDYRPENLIQIA